MSRIVNILVGIVLAAASAPVSADMLGKTAPPYELTLIDGTKISSASLRGEVVILNFWATWCVPCRKELPLLDAYYEQATAKNWGLKVYAVTTEGSVPIFKLKKLFDVLHIAPARRIKGPFAPIDGAVPTNFIIDRAGVVRYAKAAAFDLDDLNRELVPLIREPRPN